MSNESAPPRRLGRRLVVIAAGLIVLLVLVVALLPTLLGTGPGRRLVASVAGGGLAGEVTLGSLDLSWFGDQSIGDLVITSPDGRAVTDLDLHVDRSLLDLVRRRGADATVTVSGRIDAEVRPDGSTSIGDAVASAEPDATPAPDSSSGPALPADMQAALQLDGLDVRISETETGRTLELSGLDGSVVLSSAQPISMNVRGTTTFEGTDGSIEINGTIRDLLQSSGALTFDGAALDGAVTVRTVVIPMDETVIEVSSFDAAVASADLTDAITLTASGTGTVNGDQASSIEVDLTGRSLVTPDGAVELAIDRLEGTVRARTLPTALVQPFLAETPVVASRDVGPTADVDATFGSGTTRQVDVRVEASMLTLEANATVDPSTGAVDAETVALTASLSPDLIAATLGVRPQTRLPLTASLDGLALPGGDQALAGLSVSGRAAIDGPIRLVNDDGDVTLDAESLTVQLNSPRLADGLDLALAGTVEGAPLRGTQRITNLVNSTGELDVAGASADGTLTLEGLAPDRVMARVGEDQRALARAVITAPVSIECRTSGSSANGDAQATIRTGGAEFTGRVTLTPETARLELPTATITVTDAVLAAAVAGDDPMRVATPVPIGLAMEPVELPREALLAGQFEDVTVNAVLSAPAFALLNAPGTAAPLNIAGLDARVTLSPGRRLDVSDPSLSLGADGRALATVDLEAAVGLDDDREIDVTTSLSELQVQGLETLLGRAAGSLTGVLGTGGEVDLVMRRASTAAPTTLSVDTRLDRLTGAVALRMTDTAWTIADSTLRTSVQPAVIESWLAGTAEPGAPAPTPSLRVTSPVDVTLTMRDLALDPGVLADEPIDPALVRGAIDLRAAPIRLTTNDGTALPMEQIDASLMLSGLNAPVRLDLTGGANGDASSMKVKGTISNLLSADGRYDSSGATLDLDATLSGFPTMVLDSLQNFGGRLVAALGPTIAAQGTATAFSRSGGTFSGWMESDRGRLDIPRVVGRDDALTVEADQPITARLELSKELRDDLLVQINPILADIRTVEQPLQLTVSSAQVPLDGDPARLDTAFELTTGAVEFDAGSQLLGVLELFNTNQREGIPGLIEPLRVNVTAGQVVYNDFTVRVGSYEQGYKHTLKFFGDIDLASTPVVVRSIKARYPGDGIAKSVKEVPAIAGIFYVEFDFFGPLYNAQGQRIPLEMKVNVGADLPQKPEDILKDENVQKGINDLFRKLLDK